MQSKRPFVRHLRKVVAARWRHGAAAILVAVCLGGGAPSAIAAPLIEYTVEGVITSVPQALMPFIAPNDRFRIVGTVNPATPDLTPGPQEGAFELAWQQGTIEVGNTLLASFGVNPHVNPGFPTNTANFSNDIFSNRDLLLFQSELDPTLTLGGLSPLWLSNFINADGSWFSTSDFPIHFVNTVLGGASSNQMTVQFEDPSASNGVRELIGRTDLISARTLNSQVIGEPSTALMALGTAGILFFSLRKRAV